MIVQKRGNVLINNQGKDTPELRNVIEQWARDNLIKARVDWCDNKKDNLIGEIVFKSKKGKRALIQLRREGKTDLVFKEIKESGKNPSEDFEEQINDLIAKDPPWKRLQNQSS